MRAFAAWSLDAFGVERGTYLIQLSCERAGEREPEIGTEQSGGQQAQGGGHLPYSSVAQGRLVAVVA